MAGIRKRKGEILVKLANTDGLIPVALYIRVSSAGQDVENSVDAQLKHLKKWAKENGYVIVRIFIDEAKSGRSGKRPNFQEMIREAEEPDCPFGAVAVYKFSRFYRNAEESAVYKNFLRKKGIPVISINESMEDSAIGRLSEGFLELVNQYQSENTSKHKRGSPSRHLQPGREGVLPGSKGTLRNDERAGGGREEDEEQVGSRPRGCRQSNLVQIAMARIWQMAR